VDVTHAFDDLGQRDFRFFPRAADVGWIHVDAEVGGLDFFHGEQ